MLRPFQERTGRENEEIQNYLTANVKFFSEHDGASNFIDKHASIFIDK